MGKHKPPKRDIFAISKSIFQNPLFTDMGGVEYTQHYLSRNIHKGKPQWFIVDREITRAEALALIKEYEMEVVEQGPLGTIWETHPISLRNECLRLGLTYTNDLRKF